MGEALNAMYSNRHSWTKKELLVLFLTIRFYLNNWKDVAKAMNQYFLNVKLFRSNRISSYFVIIYTRLSSNPGPRAVFEYIFDMVSFESLCSKVL
jgi:hypothetical protein